MNPWLAMVVALAALGSGTAVCGAAETASQVLIVRGELIGTGAYGPYRVTEIGRGELGAKEIQVMYIREMLDGELPADAILLLGTDISRERLKEERPRAAFYVSWTDPNRAILPYSPEAWASVLSKTDAELSDTPEGERMPMRDALRMAGKTVVARNPAARHIRYYPPGRLPFGWRIEALVAGDSRSRSEYVILTDSGKVQPPLGGDCGMRVDTGDTSTEEKFEAYLREQYKGRPEQMPRRIEEFGIDSPAEKP
jgi:hypothetical protein